MYSQAVIPVNTAKYYPKNLCFYKVKEETGLIYS